VANKVSTETPRTRTRSRRDQRRLSSVPAGSRTLLAWLRLVKGWFAQTIPGVRDQVGPIALLHLDGEWYESTKTCLDLLHDSVVPAGWVVVDDYGH
jgi:hypothetical protein